MKADLTSLQVLVADFFPSVGNFGTVFLGMLILRFLRLLYWRHMTNP